MKADISASLLAHSETSGMVSGLPQGSLLQRQQRTFGGVGWKCSPKVYLSNMETKVLSRQKEMGNRIPIPTSAIVSEKDIESKRPALPKTLDQLLL